MLNLLTVLCVELVKLFTLCINAEMNLNMRIIKLNFDLL